MNNTYRVMKLSFHLLTLVALSIMFGCTKEGASKIKDVDDVCTMMDDLDFMKYCYDNFDVNHDGMVSMSEAHAAKSIDVSSKGISSLKGIEFFDELTSLKCSNNNLAFLNISNNLQLKELYCSSNQLSSLNLSKCIHLQTIYCGANALNSLDVSKMSDLYYLSCTDNQITALDVSKNPLLNTLFCSANQLKSLNISKNSQLNHLRCSSNQISSLDLSHTNQLVTLVFSHNRIEDIDISVCPNVIRGSNTTFGHQNDEIIIRITDKKEYWNSLPSDNISTNGRIQWIWK